MAIRMSKKITAKRVRIQPEQDIVTAYFELLQKQVPDEVEVSTDELNNIECNQYIDISWEDFKKECGIN